jgi:hypothetical protein
MYDTQKAFEEVYDKFVMANVLLQEGNTLDDVYKQLDIDAETLEIWVDRLSLPENAGEILTASPILGAVFPIFAAENENAKLDHIGSGVVVKIGEELFALSAAHVTDFADGDGALFMPAVDGIEQMTGGRSYSELPQSGSRDDDLADIAYYRLSSEWLTKLHPAFKPLSVNDLLLTDELETGNIFSFAGYPWRKTKSRSQEFETERTTYSGHAVAPDVYRKLGYNRYSHVAVRMRRKKTYSYRYSAYKVAPHPLGISGGGVIAWPWNYVERHDPLKMKLAAIGHTFHEDPSCLVATRIIPLVMVIVRNNPSLAIHFKGLELAQELEIFINEKMSESNSDSI